ncbi:hypothetical protein L207DRAFT_584112 [Hyaloscypha variabilis F]|uniref:Clr5 domain-containing protein n=1 Tax=Hyaloscypha variabilis (strain UAMH 11265 / GT02V1 / F) TaxID=1149755 RepID=A0A2J6RJK9_HYAVF|nr:hypothetical protein L207DRAFT_584112 [Hyaloscypha variabilis F]
MNTFESSPSPAALPVTFIFIENGPSAKPTSLHISTLRDVQISSEHLGITELKRQQWESLKPLIQRVYIEEDKPFHYVADILSNEHGFEPSKRQFLRKMNEWGFRKNVSRSERLKILEAMPRSMHKPALDLKDRRLKPGKLKNWRRRYRDEVKEAPLGLSQVNNRHSESMGYVETQIPLGPDTVESLDASSAQDPCKILAEESGAVPRDTVEMEIFQDVWPFDWSTVDVPGSPGLSRLFKGLEIECATPIPPLSLDSSDLTCLSNSEIRGLSKNCLESPDGDCIQNPTPVPFLFVETSTTNQQQHWTWGGINTVYCMSPWNEVYVFPFSQKARPKALDSKMTYYESLETRQASFESNFAKLKPQFKADNPAVIAIMENLALTYDELSKFKKAELMYRELVSVYHRTLGPQDPRTLGRCIDVVRCVMCQGETVKANSLHQNLRSEIPKIFPPDHPLAISNTGVHAILAESLNQDDTAEKLQRQLLQMNLASAGPRNLVTIHHMTRLAAVMYRKNINEGELLLRTAVQLSADDPIRRDKGRCEAMRSLAYLLGIKGAHQEEYRILIEAVERSSSSLGPRDLAVILLKIQLAWALFRLRRYNESENLFRDLISLYLEGEIERNEEILASAGLGLANVLWWTDRVEEAACWYEKSFEAKYHCYGDDLSNASTICNMLGSCYEQLGRYDDALKLYRQFMDEIRESGNGSVEAIAAELESKILLVEEQIEQFDTSSYTSDQGISGYEPDSSNDEVGAEEKVKRECYRQK